MDRIDKILNHDLFLYHLGKNNAAEADRRFCRHSMVHFLDVARIGTIIALEEGLELDREWIYAAALLHDCGKHEQYENGTPHEQPVPGSHRRSLRTVDLTIKKRVLL